MACATVSRLCGLENEAQRPLSTCAIKKTSSKLAVKLLRPHVVRMPSEGKLCLPTPKIIFWIRTFLPKSDHRKGCLMAR